MKKSILIVDDSSYYRSRGAEIVERAGYNYYFAEDGKKALQMYSKIRPDYVTMDICMPIMDGYVPVYRQQAFANGACGILPKSYDLDDLEQAIEEADMIK